MNGAGPVPDDADAVVLHPEPSYAPPPPDDDVVQDDGRDVLPGVPVGDHS